MVLRSGNSRLFVLALVALSLLHYLLIFWLPTAISPPILFSTSLPHRFCLCWFWLLHDFKSHWAFTLYHGLTASVQGLLSVLLIFKFLTDTPSNEHLAEVFLARVELSMQEDPRGQKLCALPSLLGLSWVRPGVRWVLWYTCGCQAHLCIRVEGWALPSAMAVSLAGTLESLLRQWNSSNRI